MDAVKFQYLSKPEIKAYQEKKMAETLVYVNSRSPYYKELFVKEKIDICNNDVIEFYYCFSKTVGAMCIKN